MGQSLESEKRGWRLQQEDGQIGGGGRHNVLSKKGIISPTTRAHETVRKSAFDQMRLQLHIPPLLLSPVGTLANPLYSLELNLVGNWHFFHYQKIFLLI